MEPLIHPTCIYYTLAAGQVLLLALGYKRQCLLPGTGSSKQADEEWD